MDYSALLLASEGFLDWAQDVDRVALLAVNGSDSLFLDSVVHILTTPITWVPFYISLFYLVLKNNNSLQRIAFIVGCAGLCILFAGAVDDLIVKPTVARWRPTHDPVIGTLVDVVNGYRGGKYGFFSAHACNTFSIAIFFCWLVRSWALSLNMILWSLVNCWTRLYLGVHFTRHMRAEGRRYISTDYTDGGYERPSCDIPVAVFYFTLIIALLIATYQ